MDQKKIGRYIADKRKALGLTQVQLAEKLNMSNKSVSKWERGVCLPDVSLYEKLCEALEISLNEFLAGEDLSETEIISKSEETIIHIATDSKRSRHKANFLALLLAVIVIAIFGIIAGPLDERLDEDQDGFFDGGVTSLREGSAEVQMAKQLGDGEVYLYRYNVRESYNRMQIRCYWYEDGSLMEESTLLSYVFSGAHDGEGLIAIIEDDDTGSLAVEVTLEGEDFQYGPDGTVCGRFELPLDGRSLDEWQEQYSRSIYVPQGKKMRLDASSETGLLVMTFDESDFSATDENASSKTDESFSSEASEKVQDTEFWPKVRTYCPEFADQDYTVFLTVKTWHEPPVDTWRPIYKVWP